MATDAASATTTLWARFGKWNAFRDAHPAIASALLEALTASAENTIFDRYPATLAIAEALLASLRPVAIAAAARRLRNVAASDDVFRTGECARCLSFVLSAARSVAACGQARSTVQADVVCCASPLLRDVDFVFDVEGVLLTCSRARDAADTDGTPASAKKRRAACARRLQPSQLTCAPEGAISKGALALLFVPSKAHQQFDAWLRFLLQDAKRESEIAAHYKPGWCAGLTVANIISSGMCGGFVGDRRKKKKAGAPGSEAASAPSGKRRGARAGAVSAKRGRRRQPRSFDKLPEDVAAIIDEFAQGDVSLKGAAKILASGTLHLVDGDEDAVRREDEGGGGEEEEDDPDVIRGWFWDPESSIGKRSQAISFGVVAAEETGGRGEADSAPLSAAQFRIDLDRDVIASAGPNAWVDLRNSAGSGSPWTRELLPCGCTLEMLAAAAYSAMRVVVVRDAETIATPSAGGARVHPHAAAALTVDLMCGTLTRRTANSAWLKSMARTDRSTLLALANCVSAAPASSQPPAWRALAKDWSATMTTARRVVAGAATAVRPMSGLAQAWYFARVRSLSWVHEATEAARAHGMPGRAEEIASTAAQTREADDAGLTFKRRKRMGGQAERAPTAAVLTEPPSAWPCDAAWAASLAAEKMRLKGSQVGVVIPLADSASAVIFPGRRAACLGGLFRSDANATAATRVDATPDGRDAYVAGAVAHMLGSGQTVASDCCLLYPIAFLLLTCGGAARTAQRAAFSGCVSNPATAAAASRAWDELIWSAVAFVADACSCCLRGVGLDSVLAVDAGRLTPPTGGDDGESDDAAALFHAYRVLGKLVIMACAQGNNSAAKAERMRKGIYCASRPKKAWKVGRAAAREALTALASTTGMDLLRRALTDAVASADATLSATVSLAATSDRRERSLVNVSLLVYASSCTSELASAVLESIDLAGSDDDPPACGVGLLSSYRLPLSSGSFFRRFRVPRMTDTGMSSLSAPSAGAACSPSQVPDEEIAAADRDAEDDNAEIRTPCLALLSSEFMRFCAQQGESVPQNAEAAWRFVMETEVAARAIKGCLTNELAEEWKKISRACCTLQELKRACAEAWRAGRGVPLSVFACTSEFASSDAYLPMADHPMSNTRGIPIVCAGCGVPRYPEHRDDYPFAHCYPLKQGALMSEIVHAKAGAVILPHGASSPKGWASGRDYVESMPSDPAAVASVLPAVENICVLEMQDEGRRTSEDAVDPYGVLADADESCTNV